jgi:RNA polymerase sigma-70 factor (ECF subfamily)
MDLTQAAATYCPSALAEAPAEAPASFDRIYDEHVDFVWRSARRLGVSESAVDDIVQQVFLIVHRRLGEFEHRSSYKTWIFSILLRAVSEHRRSVRRKSPHWLFGAKSEDPELLEAPHSPEEELAKAEAARLIEKLLESLDDDKRAVFVLAELEQMNAAEIAEATGTPTKTVYSRLRAARADFERAAERMRKRDSWRTG